MSIGGSEQAAISAAPAAQEPESASPALASEVPPATESTEGEQVREPVVEPVAADPTPTGPVAVACP